MRIVKQPFDQAVIASTHTARYMMHKYWARKPHNVVRSYIEYYTEPGDVVLDPFMGSGVTVIEAAHLGRQAIGNDLNPVACFITEMTLVPVKLNKLKETFDRVETSVGTQIASYYAIRCRCGKEGIATHVVWKQERYASEKMFLLHVACPHCGKKEKRKPNDDDLQRYVSIARQAIPFFYPKDVPLHETAKRSVTFIHELFTHRALICLSILLHEITLIPDKTIRDIFKFCFTSALAQVSRMPPHAPSSGISWKVPNYWVPPVHWEQNVFHAFEERFRKIVRGKADSDISEAASNARIINENATSLSSIGDCSIDYIFTDPPYGDSVPYFGLSLMWAAWLGWDKNLDFDKEIVISERGNEEQELDDYRRMLGQSFREIFRVLKSGGTVTVTFHNREIRVWNALVTAAFEAGFLYQNDNYVLPAVKSSKSQLAKSGSMTGDIYINFRKPENLYRQRKLTLADAQRVMTEEAKKVVQSRNGQATTDQLARGIYSHLIKENLFGVLETTDIRKLLTALPLEEVMPNVWKLRKTEPETMLAYIPLAKRIEFIVDGVLESGRAPGHSLDDFLIPIFTQLKNGLTPENDEIMDVLRGRAYVKRSKWISKSRTGELFPFIEGEPVCVLPETELREHEQFIYQLARLGASLGYHVWVGKNEQNKSALLQDLSLRRLEIPGLSEKFISDNRVDQIDLIWLDTDAGKYAAFEIENSTGVVPGIQRLANLTAKLSHLNIPTYIVIPDKFRSKTQRIFESPSGRKLADEQRKFIVYSKLLHHIDLLARKLIAPRDLLDTIAE